MKFFGAPFDAPIYQDIAQDDVPVGKYCLECEREIVAEDRGFIVPLLSAEIEWVDAVYHRGCLMRTILGPRFSDVGVWA